MAATLCFLVHRFSQEYKHKGDDDDDDDNYTNVIILYKGTWCFAYNDDLSFQPCEIVLNMSPFLPSLESKDAECMREQSRTLYVFFTGRLSIILPTLTGPQSWFEHLEQTEIYCPCRNSNH
jgi:hypothetical protein